MKSITKWTVVLWALTVPVAAGQGREIIDFNEGWRFARFENMPDGTYREEPTDLQAPGLDDSGWLMLDVPHDWGIAGPFRDDIPNFTGKLPWAGIGWYRKSFPLSKDDDRQVFIEFDGAMSDTQVWLNGEYVGRWPYGYASFRLDLTPHVRRGVQNVLAVRLNNRENSARWYPGGGIYRHVRLVKTGPLHVDHWGVYVTTPQVGTDEATVRIRTEIENRLETEGDLSVLHEIFRDTDPPMKVAAATTVHEGVSGGVPVVSEVDVLVAEPALWDIDHPDLYFLMTHVKRDGEIVDSVRTRFGIRSIEFIADRGFILNGRTRKLQGVCLHHDLGALGAAVHRRAIERQIEIMQAMGANAIRSSHNPPAPEMVELCDRMGMLLIVEAFDSWEYGKTPNDYSRWFHDWHERDLINMVRRDRNYPSVIMWSTGNEVHEATSRRLNTALSQLLRDIVRREDPMRPVTVACNAESAAVNGFQNTVDVFGFNYKPHRYGWFQERNPDLPVFGIETSSTISSRGEYFFPVSDDPSQGQGGFFQVSSYNLSAVHWGNIPDIEFAAQEKYPAVLGEFVWTGFDYLGEPTPYNRDRTILHNFQDPDDRRRAEEELERLDGHSPARSSYFGIVDLAGFPKDRYYLYQAHWRPDWPMVHILPHWTWPERVGEVTPVHVYTSGDEAELFLNGESLGRKRREPFTYRFRWDDVLYEPGELRVVAYREGTQWAEQVMRTAGPAARINMIPDRQDLSADGRDLSFITVRISDADGIMVPRADHLIEFEVEGPGEIVGVDNGNPVSQESFVEPRRMAFHGLCLVIVRTIEGESGTIRVRAHSESLKTAVVELAAN